MNDDVAELLTDVDLALTEAEAQTDQLNTLAEDLRSRVGGLQQLVQAASAEHGRFHSSDPEIGQRAELARSEVESLVSRVEHLDVGRLTQRIDDAMTRVLHARDRASEALDRAEQARTDADHARTEATSG